MTTNDKHKYPTHAVRFEAEVLEGLRRAAEERTVSVSWIVNRLCADGLRRLIPLDELIVTRERER